MFDIQPNQPGVFDVGQLNPILASLPEEEQKGCLLLLGNTVFLHKYVDAFAGAVALLDLAEIYWKQTELMEREDPARARNLNCLVNWNEMAGREAAMTVYHFWKCAQAIRDGMKGQTVLRQSTDHAAIKTAVRRFEAKLPDTRSLRHAVAHRAELMASAKEIATHSASEVFYYGKMNADREYKISFEKKHCTLKVDNSTRSFLAEIANSITLAFPEIGKILPLSKT